MTILYPYCKANPAYQKQLGSVYDEALDLLENKRRNPLGSIEKSRILDPLFIYNIKQLDSGNFWPRNELTVWDIFWLKNSISQQLEKDDLINIEQHFQGISSGEVNVSSEETLGLLSKKLNDISPLNSISIQNCMRVVNKTSIACCS